MGGLDDIDESQAELVENQPVQPETEKVHEELVGSQDDVLKTSLLDTRFPLNDKAIEDIQRLKETFRDLNEDETIALGLAANQIGAMTRCFIATINNKETVFINPKIVGHHRSSKIKFERCLSIPVIQVAVPRWKTVSIEYYDELGERHVHNILMSSHARLIQHEIDHLNGKLISDYIKPDNSNVYLTYEIREA